MSWHYSQALVAEYSQAKNLDGVVCAQSNLNSSSAKDSCSGKTKDTLNHFQFGMTSAHLTENHGVELLTWFRAVFHAKTFHQQEKEKESKAKDQGYGMKWRELSAKYSLDTFGWKTHRSLFQEDLPWSSVILPKWGMIRHGVLWERLTLEHITNAKGVGFSRTKRNWPTPRAADPGSRPNGKGGKVLSEEVLIEEGIRQRGQKRWPTPRANDGEKRGFVNPDEPRNGLPGAVLKWPTPQASDNRDRGNLSTPSVQRRMRIGKQINLSQCVSYENGRLNPDWVELLMGWPKGWTSSEPLPSDRFKEWLNSSEYFGQDWETGTPRVTEVRKERKNRLQSIGNGQCPQAMILAFEILWSYHIETL